MPVIKDACWVNITQNHQVAKLYNDEVIVPCKIHIKLSLPSFTDKKSLFSVAFLFCHDLSHFVNMTKHSDITDTLFAIGIK